MPSYRVAPEGDIVDLRRHINEILGDLTRRFASLEVRLGKQEDAVANSVQGPVPLASQLLIEDARGRTSGAGGFSPGTPTLDFVPDGTTRALPSLAYELSFPWVGTIPSGQEVFRHEFSRAVTFPPTFSNPPASVAKLGTATTNPLTIQLKKNGTNDGTIAFSAGGTVGTVTLNDSFVAGDVLSAFGPTPADATAADLTVTLEGSRANP